ncbi:hypothetical protein V2G26_002940 [Clonostachys chloroleuca]
MAPVFFITGASSGLGLVLTLRALSAGNRVIAAMRNPARAAEAKSKIEAAGGQVFALDVTDSQDTIIQKFKAAEAIYGQIDVLINCAGYGILGPVERFTESEVQQLFRTNVYGPLYLIQATLPSMRTRRAGTIINISSMGGADGSPANGLYASTKFALEGLSESLSKEVAEFGISVLIVEPGAFRTGFLSALVENETGFGDEYANNVSAKVLNMMKGLNGKQPGDPEKAADRMIEYATGAGKGGELRGKVLRMVLGGDAFPRIQAKIEKQQQDMELGKEVAYSTNL